MPMMEAHKQHSPIARLTAGTHSGHRGRSDTHNQTGGWMESFLIQRATRRQSAVAGVIALLILLTLAVAAPRAGLQWPAISPFMPMCALTVFTTACIAAFLLGAQFTVTRQPMLGALGGVYAFTALAVALQLLMFPGVFSPTGLFGARPTSAVWSHRWLWAQRLAGRGGGAVLRVLGEPGEGVGCAWRSITGGILRRVGSTGRSASPASGESLSVIRLPPPSSASPGHAAPIRHRPRTAHRPCRAVETA